MAVSPSITPWTTAVHRTGTGTGILLVLSLLMPNLFPLWKLDESVRRKKKEKGNEKIKKI